MVTHGPWRPGIEGSTPSHPTTKMLQIVNGQSVDSQITGPSVAECRSPDHTNPRALHGRIAEWLRHSSDKREIPGSTPGSPTTWGCGENGYHGTLRTFCYGFESCHPYQRKESV